jgi:hypothetical protein
LYFFYINLFAAAADQQLFYGSNDKAVSILNLYHCLSAGTIKETFNPPTDYKYPFYGSRIKHRGVTNY